MANTNDPRLQALLTDPNLAPERLQAVLDVLRARDQEAERADLAEAALKDAQQRIDDLKSADADE